MDYQAFAIKYKGGFPFVGAIVKMYPGPGGNRGAVIAWDPVNGEIVWSDKERFPAWSGALTTAGGVAFYGTMDGWFKAVDAKTGEDLWKFHDRPRASSVTRSPTPTPASSTSRSSTASAAGRAWASLPG